MSEHYVPQHLRFCWNMCKFWLSNERLLFAALRVEWRITRIQNEMQLVFLSSSFFKLVYLADLQNVNITLRILFRPQPHVLPKMYMNLGEDYDERVLPSITTEVLKAVVVRLSHLFSHNWNKVQTLFHSKLVVKCFISNCGLQAQFDAGELITQREVVCVGQEKNSSLVKE